MSNRPNIIFIMADDMGYGDVGCYNAESKIPTPHMDALVLRGMRFTDAHSPSAVCTPGLRWLAHSQRHALPPHSSTPVTGQNLTYGEENSYDTT